MALSGLVQNNTSQPSPQHVPQNVPQHAPQQRQPIGAAPSSASPMPNAAPHHGNSQATGQNLEGISDKDIAFLTSLAAMQLQYGRPHEAVAYLMAVRRLRPSDRQILRLLAIALMKMEAWAQADVILDEMESLSGNDGPIVYLYRSIIRFRQSDLFGAKQLFARFCALKSGGNNS